jgi:hypothetical protein
MKTSTSINRLVAFAIVFFILTDSLICSNGLGASKDNTFIISITAGIFGFLTILALKFWFERREK